MKTLLINGRVLRSDGIFYENCPLIWEDGRFTGIGTSDCDADTRVIDARGRTVLPGLIDVHTHGRAGFDFSTASVEQMQVMKDSYLAGGVTTVFPTLASDTAKGWEQAISRVQAVGFDGIHLEGRYLNPTKRGAHPTHLLAPLDPAELDDFLGLIRIPCHITAAFELDHDGSFAECALRHGATLGLGHTAASAHEARLALSRGVTAFTHLFNAMPPLHHREGGAVAVALCEEGYGELIVDGMHICPDMISLAYRCLGKERTVLITDSMEATGCADGEYAIAGQPVVVKDGKALTLDGVLAGSTLNLWDAVKNLMRFASVPFAEAVRCATLNPAMEVGIERFVGSIEVGKRADLVLVDENTMTVEGVIQNGRVAIGLKGD